MTDNTFPTEPSANGQIVHVFWVVNTDYRPLNSTERRNVIYPAKRCGLVEDAIKDTRGVKLNDKGETSVCGFVLTEEGKRYYKSVIAPLIPKDFVSIRPKQPTRRRSSDIKTSDLGK